MRQKRNVISFMNMKGGVGKTTVCVNIAGTLATMGHRVLVIDMDPQMNASQYLLSPTILEQRFKLKKTVYELFRKDIEGPIPNLSGVEIPEEVINDKDLISNVRKNLDILCGNLSMIKVTNDNNGTLTDCLQFFIQSNELQDEYAFIFIDCPPTSSIYTTSSLKASNFYILVIKPDFLSTIGLDLFENNINTYNSRRTSENKVHPLGIVINLFQRSNDYHNQKIKTIKDNNMFATVFETMIANKIPIAISSEDQKLMYETMGCKRTIGRLTKEFLKIYDEKVG